MFRIVLGGTRSGTSSLVVVLTTRQTRLKPLPAFAVNNMNFPLCIVFCAAAVESAVYPVTNEMRTGAAQIIGALLPSSGVTMESSTAWTRLAYITDTFGPRISGSSALESALDWIHTTAKTDDKLVVSEIPAWIPRWQTWQQKNA